MSSSPETPIGHKRPHTRSTTQRVAEISVDNFQHSHQYQQQADREWSTILDLTDNHSDEVQSYQVSFYDIQGDDNMPYPYSKYEDGVNVEAHIRDFLTTWEINHGAQRLSMVAEDKSKIAEFVLSLDGPLTNQFAQNGLNAFDSFEHLTTKFTQLFHHQIPRKDMISQFHATYQEPHETVSQFVIRFQKLQLQILKTIPKEELKDIFLKRFVNLFEQC